MSIQLNADMTVGELLSIVTKSLNQFGITEDQLKAEIKKLGINMSSLASKKLGEFGDVKAFAIKLKAVPQVGEFVALPVSTKTVVRGDTEVESVTKGDTEAVMDPSSVNVALLENVSEAMITFFQGPTQDAP